MNEVQSVQLGFINGHEVFALTFAVVASAVGIGSFEDGRGKTLGRAYTGVES